MSALNALMVAIELATRKRDEARQLLRQRQQSLAAAQEQMQQLQSYQAEMQQRWGAHEGAQLKPEVMYHHHQFMQRLQHAIELQTKVLRDQELRLQAEAAAAAAAAEEARRREQADHHALHRNRHPEWLRLRVEQLKNAHTQHSYLN